MHTTLQAIELRYAVPAAVAALLVLGCATEVRTKRAAAGEKSPAPAASVRLDYQIAALKVAVLAFSTLLATTFELLHCVDVNGARVVFRAATAECGAWQAPLYLLAAALLLPVAAGLAACTSRLPDLPPVLSGKLRAPYRYGCQHWEVVLALHEPTARARAPAEGGDLRLEELRKAAVPHPCSCILEIRTNTRLIALGCALPRRSRRECGPFSERSGENRSGDF